MFNSISEIHNNFFNSEPPIDNDLVIKIAEANTSLIQKSLDDNVQFEESLRIYSRYCFALKELHSFKKAENKIYHILPYFEKIYKTENEMFNNVFYEKLFSCLVYSQTYLGKLTLASNNLELLIKNCPYHDDYFQEWKKILMQKKSFGYKLSVFLGVKK